MNRTEHKAFVLSAPLHIRLQSVQLALEHGSDLRAHFAEIDGDGQITLHTHRGDVCMWRKSLASAAEGAALHYRDRYPLRIARDVAKPPPQPAPTKVAAHYPLEKTWAWKDYWATKDRPGHAPTRAVGNFTTPELAARSIADLRHNLNEAARSGNAKLIQVMRQALDRALDL